MNIEIIDEQDEIVISKQRICDIARLVITGEGAKCDEVAIHFVSIEKISDLHQTYFNDPTPTDCISFPIDDKILGDVFVCPKVALDYAKANNLDPFKEIDLYVIHGLLHLLGYDDVDPEEQKRMRKAEEKYLCLPVARCDKLKI